MATSTKPVYKCILLKLSGEALQDTEGFGTDTSILGRMTQEVRKLAELGTQVGVVTGGGNLSRGAGLMKAGMNHAVGDHMGMLTTVTDGLTVRDTLHRAYMNTRLMSAIPLNGVCDSYSWVEAISLLRNNRVVIPSADTGNPFFTTDLIVCLCGTEIEADVMLKAVKADGVFTVDSVKNPTVTMHEQLTYSEVLEKELKVMNLAASTLARDHKLPVRVFNINKPSVLHRVIVDEKEGTLVAEQFP